ncbi:MAG: hypothetical protein D6766_07760 [Verrucomicrobia bacterium]|nr:MAG: hypothetical protein D6766_07760 [Verrucomicrobiota bacterium]
MQSNHANANNENERALRRLEEEVFGLPAIPEVPENLLRDYLAGRLSLEEENRVIDLLAANPAAQQTLARLRQEWGSPAQEDDPSPASELAADSRTDDFLAAKLDWMLRRLGMAKEALVLAVREVEAGWRLLSQGPAWVQRALTPLTLDATATAPAGPADQVVELVHPDQTTVRLVRVPGSGPTCMVTLPDKSLAGEVVLERLQTTSPTPRFRPADMPRLMREGTVVFPDCPRGVLRFRLPDQRTLHLVIFEE